MEREKRYSLKERFLQSKRAFLLLEALICLVLFSFALCLFLRFCSTPKTFPAPLIHSPHNAPQFFKPPQKVILKSENLQFEALQKVWDDRNQSFVILEDFR